MSYKKLQIWVLARELVIEVHEMSLRLPRFKMYEEGAQIRRSSKTTKARSLKAMPEGNTKTIGLNSLSMHFHRTMKQWITWKIFGYQIAFGRTGRLDAGIGKGKNKPEL